MPEAFRFVVIGNPENRRVHFFQEALRQAGQPAAMLVPYLNLLNGACRLHDVLCDGAIVRVESPGESFEVEKKILALGGLENAQSLPDERGRIYYPRLWFQGFTRLMESIAHSAAHVSWFNHPVDIVRMFDKPLCKHMLQAHTLPSLPSFSCYDEFFSFVEQQSYRRFFVKLNSSSSASGIVAYAYNKHRGKEHAHSTVELVRGPDGDRYYNTLKIKRYTDRNVLRNILDFLFAQGAMVETWVPKARHENYSYDLRIVGIAGQRRHATARLSRSPMTNLHLGNRRCSVDDLELSSSMWNALDALVAHAMQAFPHSLYAGLDILLPRNGTAPVLLEANAFGDLLPNLLDRGEDTYLAEIRAILRRGFAGACAA